MKIKFKKLNLNAVIPKKAHLTDAGFDLTATSIEYDKTHGCLVYGTGIAVEIPDGYVGLVFPRSSIANRDMNLTNAVGVIDSGYRGEIMAKFKSTTRFEKDTSFGIAFTEYHDCIATIYKVGDRIAQFIILPIPEIEFCEVSELSDSDRSVNGYGSSGE